MGWASIRLTSVAGLDRRRVLAERQGWLCRLLNAEVSTTGASSKSDLPLQLLKVDLNDVDLPRCELVNEVRPR
jgi:hypothetical protein